LRSRLTTEPLMSHSTLPADRQRRSPTLWPRNPDGETPLELAIKERQAENIMLNNLVIRLSAIILRITPDGK
jgi:hypothetical protein